MKRNYSWIPDLPDQRDLTFKIAAPRELPKMVDLREQYKNIYNQGSLGSCTANAIAMAYDFERVKQNLPAVLPSRLFIYYNERVIEKTVGFDSGAMLRDGIKTVAKQGVCDEKKWPYKISWFRRKPALSCYDSAKNFLVKEYMRLENLWDAKQCLADGFGFVLGFSVYESFETQAVAATGIVDLPERGERMLGGHAVFCLGYDDEKQVFICRNSWGEAWGDGGHFYLPYLYFERGLATDFWTIRLV